MTRGQPVLTHDGKLIRGEVVERPNRFVLQVRFDTDAEPDRVFLGDPGALEFLTPGSVVYCEPIEDPSRKTDYDAVAVKQAERLVSLKAALANDLFAALVKQNQLPGFEGYDIIQREPAYPEHGRGDFRLRTANETEAMVEVKSCTHVEDGIAKFPD